VAALLEQGYVVAAVPTAAPGAERFLPAAAVHALRLRVGRARARGGRPAGKVLVAGGDLRARQAALARLGELSGWQALAGDSVGFGTLGTLDLGELRIDLVSLPGDRSQRPLWAPFAAGALGALVLLPAEGTESLLLEISRGQRLPVAIAGEPGTPVPAVLRAAPDAAPFEGRDAAGALRELLAAVARPAPAS
jgi:hypothetical protein